MYRRQSLALAGRPLLMSRLPIPAFPPSPRLPRPFVGRERERAQAQVLLRQSGVALIHGGPGTGKTALAAAVADVADEPGIWIQFAQGLCDDIEPFLWQLALPLAEIAPQTWRTLHQNQQSRWGYPLLLRLQMILQAYARSARPFLLCLDNMEHIATVGLAALVTGLCDYITSTRGGQLRLLGAGRHIPYSAQLHTLPRLTGIDEMALISWAAEAALPISATTAHQLFSETEGWPQALALLFSWLQQDPSRALRTHAIECRAIRTWLTSLVGELPSEQRELLWQTASANDGVVAPTVAIGDALAATSLVAIESDERLKAHPLVLALYQRGAL